MKKILMMLASVAVLVSCNMDFYSSDTMTSSMLKENPGAAVYTTDGNYSMFKDRIDYSNSRSGNEYSRLLLLMSELRGDNVALSGRTTDPLYQNVTYTDDPTLADLSYFWYNSYKIIYGANSNIESMEKGVSADTDHLIGENYFMRAFCHLQLCNLYATPYTRGADKPGVVLRTSTDCSVTERATVGAVYNQIVLDLQEAAALMKNGARRGDAGFISYETARGLLTRVYLYMGEWDKCIELAEDMFGGNPAANLEKDIATYYANTRTSVETLWCIAKLATDPDYSPKSQIASMYYSPDSIGGTGWCEMYWSDPLMQLIFRHPEDKRLSMWGTIGATNDGTVMIHWPVIDEANRFRLNANVNNITGFDKDAATNSITYQGKTYTVRRTIERTGYPEYYIENLYDGVSDDNDGFMGPTETQVYVRDNVTIATGIRQTFPAYTMAKFSGQDEDLMLSSPAMLRWAEVVLNAAEAYAHKGDITNALKYTNVIRTRADIPVWENEAAYKAEGYTDIVDVVLDERRLELCFEGHRAIDLYRNGKSLDRRFAGVQDWEVIDMEGMDFRYPYCIPFEETSVSHIAGNGKNY